MDARATRGRRLLVVAVVVFAGLAVLLWASTAGSVPQNVGAHGADYDNAAGVAGVAVELSSGVYRVKVAYSRSARVHESLWELTVSGNRIRGKSFWKCCPGERTDPISGTSKANRAVLVRDCRGQGIRGQGIKGPCSQTFVLNRTSDTTFKGTHTGTASQASPIVTMTMLRECAKTYLITPSGAKIRANRKFVELPADRVTRQITLEQGKYKGFDYRPVKGARVTRKQNCAGYVMQKLFGAKIVQANIEPDVFFAKIVKPFGHERGWRAARKDYVAVYRHKSGAVKHVAIVKQISGLLGMRILTKDGNERLYDASFPKGPNILSNDPLIRTHAPGGSVEFWDVDLSRVDISAVSPAPCDAN